MSKEDNIAAQEHLAQNVNAGNIEAAVESFAPSAVDHDPAPEAGFVRHEHAGHPSPTQLALDGVTAAKRGLNLLLEFTHGGKATGGRALARPPLAAPRREVPSTADE